MQAAKLVIYFYNLLVFCEIKYKKMLLRLLLRLIGGA